MKKYKECFCDTLNPNISPEKVKIIYNSRKRNQDLLCNNNNNFGNFSCSSPFVEKTENYIKRLKFALETSDLNKNLFEFSKKNKNFTQFINKKSKHHPRIFKRTIKPYEEPDLLNKINWDKIISLDMYSDKDYFNVMLVSCGEFFNIFVNKECIIFNVSSLDSLFEEENFVKFCKILNVTENELINFIEYFVF